MNTVQLSITICRDPSPGGSVGKTSPWDAEPRIELGPALQQADALTTVLRRTSSFLF